MRPKESRPTGVCTSAQARFTVMELRSELTPSAGGTCVNVPTGNWGALPLNVPAGVDPNTTLSSMSICDRTRTCSEMFSVGSSLNRMFALVREPRVSGCESGRGKR